MENTEDPSLGGSFACEPVFIGVQLRRISPLIPIVRGRSYLEQLTCELLGQFLKELLWR